MATESRRPKDEVEKHRATVLLSTESNDFVRWYASSKAIHLSTAMNILLSAILAGDFGMLRTAAREFYSRRQF